MITHRLMFGALTLAANIYAGVVLAEKINMNNLSETVRILASDEYGGRAPGTEGETKNGRIPYPAL